MTGEAVKKRGLRFCVIAILLPVALTACSGGGGSSTPVSPTDYMGAVCSHVQTWITDIRQGFQQLQEAARPGTAPDKGKDLLRSFFDRAVSDTDAMISGIEDAGTPAVQSGQAVASSLISQLQRARAALDTARKAVDTLPTSSQSAFQQAANSLGSQIQSNMSGIGTAISALHSPELEQAAKKAPDCTSLG